MLYQQTVTLRKVAASATWLQIPDGMPATFRNGDPMIDRVSLASAQITRASFQVPQFPFRDTENTVLFQTFLTSSRILTLLRAILRTVRSHVGADLVPIPGTVQPLVFEYLFPMRGRIPAGLISRFL
jgi:hypothetical protein